MKKNNLPKVNRGGFSQVEYTSFRWVRKQLIVIVVFLFVVSIGSLVGISYAIFTKTLTGSKSLSVTTGTLKVDFQEGNAINLNNAYPMSDSAGLKTSPYTFTIKNSGNIKAYYTISFEENNSNTLNNQYVKYKLTGNNGYDSGIRNVSELGIGNIEVVEEQELTVNQTVTYTLYLWLSDQVGNEVQGQTYQNKIVVNGYSNATSRNSSSPMLASNMIPVVYDEGKSNWVKADVSKDWYNYEEQKWANAVTVSESSRSTYLSANAGTTISMEDINTMWVWIPRYSYTIKSEDGTNYFGKQGEYLSSTPTQALPGEIDVKFIPTSTKERGTAKYIGDTAKNWRTPDGFTFGDQELSGLWYAKFETSNLEGEYLSNNNALTPIVKPKIPSWRSVQFAKFGTVSMNMTKSNNIYGLSSNEVDSHVSKNSEWASVAYLSQSKYGKLGNTSYTGANKEIYINNYNGYRTGCSSGEPKASESTTCTGDYDDVKDRGNGTGSIGGGASTTGNIYGIYDMNGGAWEYVMGSYKSYSGYNTTKNSGYTGILGETNEIFTGIPFPEQKYYSLYTTDDATTACNGSTCTGQALNETAGWYRDAFRMVNSQSPWQVRGGNTRVSSSSGIFYSNLHTGEIFGDQSFRLVLTNQ